RGIVHSERTPKGARQAGQLLHGIQLWVALPAAHEEVEPEFFHHPAATIPSVEQPGVRLRVLAGSAYGQTSPVKTYSPLSYVEAQLQAGAELELPGDHPERAAYIASGSVSCGGEHVREPKLLVFRAGHRV